MIHYLPIALRVNVCLTRGNDLSPLRLEMCKICEKSIKLRIDKSELVIDLTGTCMVADLHGINHDKPHVRVLYVDEAGSVRSFTVIEKIAGVIE